MCRLEIFALLFAALFSIFQYQPAVAENAEPEEFSREKEKPASFEELLKAVEKKALIRQGKDLERLMRFENLADNREKIAEEAEQVRIDEEKRGEILQKQYADNDLTIRSFRESISRRHGNVKEILGHLTVAAAKSEDIFRSSAVSAEFANRADFAEKLRLNRFPSIEDMERLWFELQREMAATGRTARFSADVYDFKGRLKKTEIVRIGGFNLVGSGGFLIYDAKTGQVKTLSRQPESHFAKGARRVFSSENKIVKAAIDPSRGAILSLFVRAPGFGERIEQGGSIGYLIIVMGLAGFALSLLRARSLSRTAARMRAQALCPEPRSDNPLGRLLLAYENSSAGSADAAEIALAETIRAETARFEKFLPFIKFTYVCAPLLGLLGTVVGMIKTFQVISFFGSADPKLLAGGISQALVTTVMGLCVAIAVLLLHTFVRGKVASAAAVLEQKAAALVALKWAGGEKGAGKDV